MNWQTIDGIESIRKLQRLEINNFLKGTLMTIDTTLLVQDLMSRNVVTASANDMLYDAIREMEIASLTALPVIDTEGKVCGILSNSDLLCLTYGLQCDIATLPYVSDTVRKTLSDAIAEDHCDARVSSAMNSDVETILPTATISEASQSLIFHAVHHLPVVDADNRPVGIISAMDIVRAVAVHAQ